MIVSIGLLARNEAARIGATLRSLLAQSVFAGDGAGEWELVVVANGCSDATAAAAAAALQCRPRRLRATVVELETPGKSNAWNRFVHDWSRKDAEALILLDADIEFGHPDTLRNALRALAANPAADVVVDLPLNHIRRKQRKTPLERLRLALSPVPGDEAPGIAGSFYCARAHVLRGIWMPAGLSAEDGFLRSMVVTDLFRREGDERKVVRAKDAWHFYDGGSLAQIFRRELRIAIGTALNCYFTWDFLKFATDPQGPGAGVLIRNCAARDPGWYGRLIHNAVRNRGWWVLPRGMVTRRARGRRLPAALALLAFDLAICLAANRRLKRHAAIGFW